MFALLFALVMLHLPAFFLFQTPAPSPSGTPSRLLSVAAISFPVVYIVLQLIKKWLPQVGGIGAILLNFALSAGAYMIGLPQDQWFTMATLIALATSVSAAAGIHGTVSSMKSSGD
ncbi:MAG: hypothetical protein ACRDQZ_19485 [Mycobacteriales bacterium]